MGSNYLKKYFNRVLALLIVSVIALQIYIPAEAKVASPSIASSYVISRNDSYSLNAEVSGSNLLIYLNDERVSDNENVHLSLYKINDNAKTEVKNEREEFFDGQSVFDIDFSDFDDGNYEISYFYYPFGYTVNEEIDENGEVQYVSHDMYVIDQFDLVVKNGIPEFYSVNGQGEIDFLAYVNNSFSPSDFAESPYIVSDESIYNEIVSTAGSVTEGCISEEEKVRAIHDWICTNIAYDYQSYYKGDIHDAATPEWVFRNKRAVCSGYSRLANIMLTKVGVPTLNVSGFASRIREGTDYSTNHEWNLVYYNGEWHINDFTWDSSNKYYGEGESGNVLGQDPKYEYYDVFPFVFGQDHMSIDVDLYYYQRLSVTIYARYTDKTGQEKSTAYSTNFNELNKTLEEVVNEQFADKKEGLSWKIDSTIGYDYNAICNYTIRQIYSQGYTAIPIVAIEEKENENENESVNIRARYTDTFGTECYNEYNTNDNDLDKTLETVVNERFYDKKVGVPWKIDSTIGYDYNAICNYTIRQIYSQGYTAIPIVAIEEIKDEVTKGNVITTNENSGTAVVNNAYTGGQDTVDLSIIEQSDIYRMYNPMTAEHLYTKDVGEVEWLTGLGWNHEAESDYVVVDARDEDAIPVYRLFNPYTDTHHYTESVDEVKYDVSIGWIYERISHYVYDKNSTKGTPQWRLYEASGAHNWTSDQGEISWLESMGWINEGIRWRVL